MTSVKNYTHRKENPVKGKLLSLCFSKSLNLSFHEPYTDIQNVQIVGGWRTHSKDTRE
jgi:hypothetical protein